MDMHGPYQHKETTTMIGLKQQQQQENEKEAAAVDTLAVILMESIDLGARIHSPRVH